MEHSRRALVLLIIVSILACAPGALSQCVTGNINVKGMLENPFPRAAQAEVTVIMKKGKISKAVDVTGGEFSIDVPFSTLTSYSFLWGHRCNNSPVSVIVKITSGDKLLARENLTIKDSFRTTGEFRYTLWKNLVVREANGAGAEL